MHGSLDSLELLKDVDSFQEGADAGQVEGQPPEWRLQH